MLKKLNVKKGTIQWRWIVPYCVFMIIEYSTIMLLLYM